MEYLQELAGYAREYRIRLASHDDDTPAKIDLMDSLGVTIAEFPLCLDTAIYARGKKMSTGMGAPNIVRGKSQSGNISARYLVQEGRLRFSLFGLPSELHAAGRLFPAQGTGIWAC
jgi:alpha-D-ribose 1-methylphosphonate 5-triphosphate diphosphatase